MDNTELILNGAVSPPVLLEHLSGAPPCKTAAKYKSNKVNGLSKEQREQIAKDFESIFLNKILDEMKNTIGDWGFERDGAGEQVQGIFWLYMADHLADSGGFGLWKDICQFLDNSEKMDPTVGSIDKNV
ncbi:MAG: hypothetical protein ACYS9T_09190 [Planctomycetota bacterium]|jgi:Rod binding domain-containing protein